MGDSLSHLDDLLITSNELLMIHIYISHVTTHDKYIYIFEGGVTSRDRVRGQ